MNSTRQVNVYFDDSLNPVQFLGHLEMFLGQKIDVLIKEAKETFLNPDDIDFSLVDGELKGFNLILEIVSDYSFNTTEIIEKKTDFKPVKFENPSISYE